MPVRVVTPSIQHASLYLSVHVHVGASAGSQGSNVTQEFFFFLHVPFVMLGLVSIARKDDAAPSPRRLSS